MFRRREGTGAMYADNRRRSPRNGLRRAERTSTMQRASNRDRPWMQDAPEPEALDAIDLAQLLEAARSPGHVLLGLLQDVGTYVQRCRRQRQRMPREVLEDMADLLDWYLVLYTVGLCDSRGVWLGQRPTRGAGPLTLQRT